jgi:hypothetical protein
MRASAKNAALLLPWFVGALAGCAAQELPEPESRGAQLYVRYCSGSGCHDPIPPQRDTVGYWENQYERMIKEFNAPNGLMPTPEEGRVVQEYLRKHAAP